VVDSESSRREFLPRRQLCPIDMQTSTVSPSGQDSAAPLLPTLAASNPRLPYREAMLTVTNSVLSGRAGDRLGAGRQSGIGNACRGWQRLALRQAQGKHSRKAWGVA